MVRMQGHRIERGGQHTSVPQERPGNRPREGALLRGLAANGEVYISRAGLSFTRGQTVFQHR
ncbi:putative E3 ubiquitin-protein ligase rf298 [Phtheirospermum japonicum]|uniref:Putative E3 ubiquitin-protein ligase rf298 n=1 Tax=Phtheirospermum japonicum TaxID=374723 RepID=A0A830CCY8_9LAMI|nr:putative E3 ubiquitin-protein ligase rf298 [Phtheirospermum japonicum]